MCFNYTAIKFNVKKLQREVVFHNGKRNKKGFVVADIVRMHITGGLSLIFISFSTPCLLLIYKVFKTIQ